MEKRDVMCMKLDRLVKDLERHKTNPFALYRDTPSMREWVESVDKNPRGKVEVPIELLLRDYGIPVIEVDMKVYAGELGIKGFALFYDSEESGATSTDKDMLIAVNKDMKIYDKRFVIAHELGHAVFEMDDIVKKGVNITFSGLDQMQTDEVEKRANELALELMHPVGNVIDDLKQAYLSLPYPFLDDFAERLSLPEPIVKGLLEKEDLVYLEV